MDEVVVFACGLWAGNRMGARFAVIAVGGMAVGIWGRSKVPA